LYSIDYSVSKKKRVIGSRNPGLDSKSDRAGDTLQAWDQRLAFESHEKFKEVFSNVVLGHISLDPTAPP
jgi:hypothetical protein